MVYSILIFECIISNTCICCIFLWLGCFVYVCIIISNNDIHTTLYHFQFKEAIDQHMMIRIRYVACTNYEIVGKWQKTLYAILNYYPNIQRQENVLQPSVEMYLVIVGGTGKKHIDVFCSVNPKIRYNYMYSKSYLFFCDMH